MNAPPSLSQIQITPNTPTTSDLLQCTAVASDPDETPALSYSWMLDGVEVGTNSSLELLTVPITAGELISCTITATDSEGLTAEAISSAAVSNSPPLISTLSIVPAPVYLNSSPGCAVNATDHDGSIAEEDFIWFINGSAIEIGPSIALTPAAGQPGDTLTCEVTVVDNLGDASSASTSVVLANSLPIISAHSITPDDLVTAHDTLLCEAEAEDLNGDVPQLNIEWIDLQTNQVLSGSASLNLSSTGITADDYISCTVTATDAHGGNSISELIIQVENTDPQFTLETMITPNQSIELGTELLCDAEAEDAEDGILNVSYQWNNGVQIIGSDPALTLSQSNASEGDTISCTASATDSYGTQITSTAEVIITEETEDTGNNGGENGSGGSGTGGGTGSAQAGFVTIAAGTFTMGAPSGDQQAESDEQQHTVSLSNSFFLMETEVSQTDFQALMGYNPSSVYCGANCPVTNISWHEAAAKRMRT